VKMGREERVEGHNGGGKYGTKKEALEADGDGGDVKLGHEPKDQLEGKQSGDGNLSRLLAGETKDMNISNMLTMTMRHSPMTGVMNPETDLAMAMPSQNPVAVMPLANSAPLRILIMNTTIQPPTEIWVPRRIMKERAQSQVMRA